MINDVKYKILCVSIPSGIESIIGLEHTLMFSPFNPTTYAAKLVYPNSKSLLEHVDGCIPKTLPLNDSKYERVSLDVTATPGYTHTLHVYLKEQKRNGNGLGITAEVLADSTILSIPVYEVDVHKVRSDLKMRNVMLLKYLLDSAEFDD